MSVGTNIQRINCSNNIQPKMQTNFRAQTPPVQDYQSDTVEIKGKKKKLSVGAKIAIGLGVLISGTVVSISVLSKRMPKKLENLYKEKLIPKIFDKELTFSEAKTKDEAIKYAKDILGIKEIDETITLDALNIANNGIIDVVNKNIGQEVFIPTKYVYTNSGLNSIKGANDYIAFVNSNVMSKNFGELGLNKIYFENESLTKKLNERFSGTTLYDTLFKDIGGSGLQLTPVDKNGNNIKELIKKLRETPQSMSLEDKRRLFALDDDVRVIHACSDFNYNQLLKQHKIDLDISSLKTPVEIRKAIDKYCKDNKIKLICNVKLSNEPKETIYHEMGHLQDFAKNLKEIDTKHWISINEGKTVDEMNNRWSGTTYGNMEKLFKENPDKFKSKYPDLYEFLTDEKIHTTALEVSSYATTSIGEFIAETYRKMIAGEYLSDDVITLYKKYNGPLPKGFK